MAIHRGPAALTAVLVALLLALATSAAAQGPEPDEERINVPAGQFADLLVKSQEWENQRRIIELQRQEIAARESTQQALRALVDVEREKSDQEKAMKVLARERADHFEAEVTTARKDARGARRRERAVEYGAGAAAVCGISPMPLLAIPCGLGAGLYGWLTGGD